MIRIAPTRGGIDDGLELPHGGGTASGSPTTAITAAGVSVKVSSGNTERMARRACGPPVPGSRIRRRATLAAGKLASATTSFVSVAHRGQSVEKLGAQQGIEALEHGSSLPQDAHTEAGIPAGGGPTGPAARPVRGNGRRGLRAGASEIVIFLLDCAFRAIGTDRHVPEAVG